MGLPLGKDDATAMQNRDIIVIGASLGGVEALGSLAAQLPADLPAAVFVVQHRSAASPNLLPGILAARGPLPAIQAEDGMAPSRGCIYVAPADRHLLVTADGVRVGRGPRENRSRPAIDPLFRTAAVNYGSRVIGVVLTGMLQDGAAGLAAVACCGGVPVVQDPADAPYAEMPRSALAAVGDAHQVPLSGLGALLARLAAEPAGASCDVPDALRLEARLTERAMPHAEWNSLPGRNTDFTCPECSGAIRRIGGEGTTPYRCRVGHAYSVRDLEHEKARSVETSLWVALQSLQERASMLESLAERERVPGDNGGSDASYRARAIELREHADRLRDLILSLTG